VRLWLPTFASTKRRARPCLTPFQSSLTGWFVALSLIVQLFAAPAPPVFAAPAFGGADDAGIATELRALFGDTAQLCVQVNDERAPAQHHPCGHCDDQCPLCRFTAQIAAIVASDLSVLIGRRESEAHAIRAPPDGASLPAYPAQPNPARAPPLSV
jgi:hypothetical protein